MDASVQKPVMPLKVLVPFLIGAAVSVGLGVYASQHTPTGRSILNNGLFFSGTLNMKAWLATAAIALAAFQLLSALRIYGKLGSAQPGAWIHLAHRASGTLAFLVSVPVAYHCLWALGFQHYSTRVLIHSLAGCFFYGAFTVKVLAVRARGLPDWVLPLVGGAVLTALVAIWFTSAWWFFTTDLGLPKF
jgi:hypothetical protein